MTSLSLNLLGFTFCFFRSIASHIANGFLYLAFNVFGSGFSSFLNTHVVNSSSIQYSHSLKNDCLIAVYRGRHLLG
jgi:hypothetical protein